MKELSPTHLMFQSFRHSQGNFGAQMQILECLQRTTRTELDFNPSSQELRRYLGYITGDGQHHINYQDIEGEKGAQATIERSLATLKTEFYKMTKGYAELETSILHGLIASNLLYSELNILNPDDPWKNTKDNETERRQIRLQKRVSSGKSSFLYYYGRDAQPTGISLYDDLYADVWGVIASPQDRLPQNRAGLIETIAEQKSMHAKYVKETEEAMLGHTLLAHSH